MDGLLACPRREPVTLNPEPLFNVVGGTADAGTFTARWRISIGDPRVWVKAGILWVPNVAGSGPNTLDSGGFRRLWAALRDTGGDLRGRGDLQGPQPLENVLGTSGARVDVPTDTDKFGELLELRTAANELYLELQSSLEDGAFPGRWFAIATVSPTADVDRDEWQDLRKRFEASGITTFQAEQRIATGGT